MKKIINRLNAKETSYGNEKNFIYGLPIYSMPNDTGIEVLFSSCDFKTNEILKPKAIVDFLFKKDGKTVSLKFSEPFLLDVDNVKDVIISMAMLYFN
jgi:hypothetical protein